MSLNPKLAISCFKGSRFIIKKSSHYQIGMTLKVSKMTWHSVSILALTLTAQNLVLAEEEQRGELALSNYLGDFPFYAATSCQQILQFRPNTPSGNYWIRTNSGLTHTSCNMNATECGPGAWTVITSLDMTKSGSSCPSGLHYFKSYSKTGCRKNAHMGCSSVTFFTNENSYSKICGKIVGYQHGSTDAFKLYYARTPTRLEDQYVDGISLTFNSPNEHIWTFAAMRSKYHQDRGNGGCPCNQSNTRYIPSFIGQDYFCETGVYQYRFTNRYYTEHALWDGMGVGTFPGGCNGTRSPWFVKNLPNLVKKNINMRVCMDENRNNEDVLIEKVFLYVR